MGGAKKLWFCLSVFLIQQLLVFPISTASTIVRYLPGFQGPLPFVLETGYVGIGESEDVQLFYYFVKSTNNPVTDPLLIWLEGGPGCSAFDGLFYQNGPLHFVIKEYNGSLPDLVSNPYSWTQVASIIYVDSPVGTGFSYSKTSQGYQTGDFKSMKQLYQFVSKWMKEHPEFQKNPFYVGGSSYTGLTGPLLAKEICQGNEAGTEVFINLKGYIFGNPVTAENIDENKVVPFSHGMALIPDELYESLKTSCKENYVTIDSNNEKCLKDMQTFHTLIKGLNKLQILEPLCPFASPKSNEVVIDRRSLRQNPQSLIPSIKCREYGYYLAPFWANDERVRNALNITEGSVDTWHRCRFLPYSRNIKSSIPYHVYLCRKGYPSLIYSGDHDSVVPFLATEEWIRSLNYSITRDWRPWIVDAQIAGYTRTYSNNMTYATVKGGGHVAPEYKPKQCFAMFKRWISGEFL